MEVKLVTDLDLSKLTGSQGAFYDDMAASEEAHHPVDDSDATLHNIVW